jgi:hypothetical protein
LVDVPQAEILNTSHKNLPNLRVQPAIIRLGTKIIK